MIAFYRALLYLYPASFRAEYGPELCAVFEERMAGSSPLRAFFAAIADVIPNAIASHFDILRQDLRYAGRTLRRSRGFALTAILVVSLGVGANTAAFSLADFVLLRPLPFPDSDRILKVWNAEDQTYQNEVSPPNYRDWKAMATKSFSGMAAYWPGAANLVGAGLPRRIKTTRVTPDLLPLLGVSPLLGNLITPVNSAGGATAVLSHELWRNQFGADPGIVGKAIRLDGTPYTIVGVMPPTFLFPNRDVDVWTSLVMIGEGYEDRTDTILQIIARLKPGVTMKGAQAELTTIGARLEQQYPDENRDNRIWTHRLRDEIGSRSRLLVLALCGAALCILLLACANLASLLLARGVSRERELAVRTALGAGRERLVRQLITESLLLAVIGGSIGVFLAWTGLPLLSQLVPTSLPIEEAPKIDVRVLAFAVALIGATGLGFGVVPALRTRVARTRNRLRSVLVIAEVTGSIVLLISSGLLMRAIWRIQALAPGFRSENVMTMRTALPLPKYGPTLARERFYSTVLEGVRALPGVKSAAYTTGLPMVRTGGIWGIDVEGDDPARRKDNSASVRYVTPGYFATLGIPLLRGRDVAGGDTRDRTFVAVISQSAARRHWPNQDAIGRRFKIALSERTVIGVVGDIRVRGLEPSSEPQVYLPSGQVDDDSIIGYIPRDLAIRSSLPAEQWLPAVRRIVASADPEQPISDVRPLSDIVTGDTAPRRVQIRLLAILSAVALLIAGVGIHGLLSFSVSQRTKELGIRRALGAQSGSIVAMVLRDGLALTIIGTLIGVAVALFVGRAMSALLFGVPPGDWSTILAAVGLSVLTALVGCVRPALSAARVDPMIAIREG